MKIECVMAWAWVLFMAGLNVFFGAAFATAPVSFAWWIVLLTFLTFDAVPVGTFVWGWRRWWWALRGAP